MASLFAPSPRRFAHVDCNSFYCSCEAVRIINHRTDEAVRLAVRALAAQQALKASQAAADRAVKPGDHQK